ncbi:conserved hypothetical protein [Paraburkholderia tropica]|uniref:hypothetical protein n=1 Tax=Paraburkholderia TaxID=1822464 RepID=UPI001CB5A81F|nr:MULTISPECIES: hypothetical protein [Paraburkholderia]CAG9214395.1 conserved hypothetical protein [Paraburkholderia tropica]
MTSPSSWASAARLAGRRTPAARVSAAPHARRAAAARRGRGSDAATNFATRRLLARQRTRHA